jgi:hypothetical protein
VGCKCPVENSTGHFTSRAEPRLYSASRHARDEPDQRFLIIGGSVLLGAVGEVQAASANDVRTRAISAILRRIMSGLEEIRLDSCCDSA